MAYVTIPKDKLKLVKRLAQGSFGTVYKALWEGQTVAAKRVDKEEGQQELRFLSQLEHPHIVKLLGMVDNELEIDVILEYCDGGDLRSYLTAHRGTHLGKKFYNWAKQAGRPIGYLKAMGVVHKDVKSPNYLITNGDILKLCDFGLAKELDATMTNATERASYPWMAPELLNDCVLSPMYDIFAYGVVVWELWTTDVPFEDSKIPAHLVMRICDKNERPPIPPDCPKRVADLLRQCWETDWKKRPNMDQLLLMIESAEHHAFQDAFIAVPWELQSEFGHQDGPCKLVDVRDTAIFPNGDTAVADFQGGSVHVYSDETKYKYDLDLSQGVKLGTEMTPKPWNVAVNADGIIFVTCNCYVLMYTAQGLYKRKWITQCPKKIQKTTKLRLHGLTIDNKGQVLVGQVKRPRYISKHRQDGSHIESIEVTIGPYYVAATSHGTIFISDLNAIQIIDSKGCPLHTLNEYRQMSFWHPRGICCYDDLILVCNSDREDTHEISCFSPSAEYRGSIPIRNIPYGVTFEANKLLVACTDDSSTDMVQVYRNSSCASTL